MSIYIYINLNIFKSKILNEIIFKSNFERVGMNQFGDLTPDELQETYFQMFLD
jgi:hypothetical protein